MDERTTSYLKGRFGDYYTGLVDGADLDGVGDRLGDGVVQPREPDTREWSYIGWGRGMVRHLSLLDLGDLDTWLSDTEPRHVYYSSARYTDPGAEEMSDKGWLSADLVFDLDADHLEGYDPDAAYSETLAACKDVLFDLLDFLEGDFGFRDMQVVFSGGRGYHVHVFDESARGLDSNARREIVDYVKGTGFRVDRAFTSETAAGDYGRSTPASGRRLRDGAWSHRIRDYVVEFADDVAALEDEDALEQLMEFDGVGEGKAEKLVRVFRERRDALKEGNLDVAGGVTSFWNALVQQAVEETAAETDEPVTTDTRRLIRLPGSLHGGTGLRVAPLGFDRDLLEEFRPLRDAVVFSDRTQTVVAEEETEIEVGGRRFNIGAGDNELPEYAAVYAMLNGCELA